MLFLAVHLFIAIYTDTNNDITLVALSVLVIVDHIFWASLPLYLPAIILLAASSHTIHEYIGFDSNLLVEAIDVEVAGHQEERLAESSISVYRPGTAQVSAREGNDNH